MWRFFWTHQRYDVRWLKCFRRIGIQPTLSALFANSSINSHCRTFVALECQRRGPLLMTYAKNFGLFSTLLMLLKMNFCIILLKLLLTQTCHCFLIAKRNDWPMYVRKKRYLGWCAICWINPTLLNLPPLFGGCSSKRVGHS